MRSPFLRRFGMPSPFFDNETGFSPAALFALAEPGVWLDPSDVANLDWRRNLLERTEQFDNAYWLKNRVTVTPNDVVAPDGTMTADKVVDTLVGSNTYRIFNSMTLLATSYTNTVYVKAAEYSWCYLRIGNDLKAWFNVSTGAVGTVNAGLTATMAAVGDGWYRLTCTIATATAGSGFALVGLTTGDGIETYTPDTGGKGLYLWGAQLELGSVATDYQRISDVNTEVLERFPRTTMFQDRAGSTAVTTPGQSVGLRLDKSKGLVLGSELVTNGDFSGGSTGWTLGTGWTVSGGVATGATATASLSSANSIGVVANKSYMVTFTITAYTSGTVRPNLGTAVNGLVRSAVGTYTELITSTGGDGRIYFVVSNFVGSIDNISVKELPGNHAVANSDAARGIYGIEPLGGRRNLLTFTEQFDNAAFGKVGSTITANTSTAPDGTTTSDRLVETATTGEHLVSSVNIGTGQKTASVYFKAAERTQAAIYFFNATNGVSISYFDLSAGTVVSGAGVISDAGNGWYRCSLSRTATANDNVYFCAAVGGSTSYAGSTSNGILIWGAQLETGSTATAYQRVVDQYNVTEAGKQTLHYVQYDGSDDGYVTPTITPGIDKVQVFAGVRKLSDAAVGMVVEHSANINTNAGAFRLTAPATVGPSYSFGSRGDGAVVADALISSGFAAPITNVITGIGDISGDVSRFRANGTQVASSTQDQGTGNFLAYPLYIGRRGGTTLPFNGRDYGICVRFGANLDASTISATENYMAQKTGVTL